MVACRILLDEDPPALELPVLGWQRTTCSSRDSGRCPALAVLRPPAPRPAPVPAPRPAATPRDGRPATDRVIEALERADCKPRRAGKGWAARCPGHDDRRASLSVGEGDGGRAVLHCHAGCSPAAVVAALGLELRDLMPDDGRGGRRPWKPAQAAAAPRRPAPEAEPEWVLERVPAGSPLPDCEHRDLGRPVATWIYRDADGWPLGVVARYAQPDGEKEIRPWTYGRLNGGPAGWQSRTWPEPKPLYGLDRLAARPDVPVVVCEGEKSCDAAERLMSEVVALTSPHGADSAGMADWSPLADRRVVVWPDHDDPGRRYAADVARLALAAGALEVRVVEVPDDWPKGWDLADDPLGGVTVGDLRAMFAAAPVVEAPAVAAPRVEVGTLLSDVVPEAVRWLWAGRIPLGKLTALDGDPGLGKSTLTLDLAARVTTSGRMPDGSEGATGGVVLLTAEDGLADTVRPRLEAAGADLRRVVALGIVGEGKDRRPVTLPDDLDLVRAAIARVGAVLVVVDPLMAFLSGAVDSHRDQDVRRALAQLAALAEETGAALVVVRHLNKTAAGNPLYRGGGSIGIIGAARAGLLVARDPKDEGRRVLAATKSNLAAEPRSWRWTLTADPGGPVYVHWIEECDIRAADLVCDQKARLGAKGNAEDLLEAALANGPRTAEDVLAEARAAGVSERTLKRARKALGVVATKVGGPGQPQRWVWTLPVDDDEGGQGGQRWPSSGDRDEGGQETTKGAKSANPQSWPPSQESGPLRADDDLVEGVL